MTRTSQALIHPVQIRMARAALGWTVRELADRTGVHANTIARYEGGYDVLSGTMKSVFGALSAEGIIFVEADSVAGFGIRLAHAPRPDQAPKTIRRSARGK